MDTPTKTWHVSHYKVKIASGGRIVIPAEVRRQLGVEEGEELLLSPGEDGYRITSSRNAIRRAQAFFAPIKEPGRSVVDEFIQERREEASKAEREFSTGASKGK